jgi:wyosine [tRNA(Phe)-imidazoG37] synthetase (radical SAM superfamily)
LGRTRFKTLEKKEYFKAGEILSELKLALSNLSGKSQIDYITFSGSGEPTLNSKLGKLLREIKKITSIPIAVITNSSLLSDKKVRDNLLVADLLLPSLDAATDDCFQKINRPHEAIRLEGIIEGLRLLRKEFKGKVWLEVMLVRGINDNKAQIEKLIQIIDSIGVDKVQLNTVVRPPAEKFALALSKQELEKWRNFIGKNCEVIGEPVCKMKTQLTE